MNDAAVSSIAGAIGEPARAKMLFALMDNRARTGTELAVIAGVSPSTASVHLKRLETERLVKVHAQGKHRYYSLESRLVARALESLSVLAGTPKQQFAPNTPDHLRAARTCYDHMAGTLGVAVHDALHSSGWLRGRSYDLTEKGENLLSRLGVNLEQVRNSRRRFAFGCLDWSERRSHIGGALGAALLKLALENRWVVQELDSRALSVTRAGRRDLAARFGIH
jgi:DNA-binding transcriptional ArsR family regulator